MATLDLKKFSKGFPNLTKQNHSVTSDPVINYNCVCWAAGSDKHWVQFGPHPRVATYWPASVPGGRSVGHYIALFGKLGFTEKSDASLEVGWDKVAIYAKGDLFMHVAKMLPDGKWSSKLGESHDISHELNALEGNSYGSVTVILRRSVLSIKALEHI